MSRTSSDKFSWNVWRGSILRVWYLRPSSSSSRRTSNDRMNGSQGLRTVIYEQLIPRPDTLGRPPGQTVSSSTTFPILISVTQSVWLDPSSGSIDDFVRHVLGPDQWLSGCNHFTVVTISPLLLKKKTSQKKIHILLHYPHFRRPFRSLVTRDTGHVVTSRVDSFSTGPCDDNTMGVTRGQMKVVQTELGELRQNR